MMFARLSLNGSPVATATDETTDTIMSCGSHELLSAHDFINVVIGVGVRGRLLNLVV
jgi:hypothetical protein